MSDYNQKLADKLVKTGFSGKEAAVYMTLVSLGGAFPSHISKETGINRTTVYNILETLTVRGLVTEIEKRKKYYYQIEKPRKLEQYAQMRRRISDDQYERMKDLVPEIEGVYSHILNKPVVRFFEGEEGVLAVYADHVDTKKPYEMLGYSNTADLMKFLPQKFIETYIRKKERIGITTRGILPDTEFDTNYNETIYAKVSRNIWPVLKHIPHAMFPYKSEITIYRSNKVSMINFSQQQPAGVIIEDQTIHDMMAMIFEFAWKGVPEMQKSTPPKLKQG